MPDFSHPWITFKYRKLKYNCDGNIFDRKKLSPQIYYSFVVLDVQISKTLFADLVDASTAACQTVSFARFTADHYVTALIS